MNTVFLHNINFVGTANIRRFSRVPTRKQICQHTSLPFIRANWNITRYQVRGIHHDPTRVTTLIDEAQVLEGLFYHHNGDNFATLSIHYSLLGLLAHLLVNRSQQQLRRGVAHIGFHSQGTLVLTTRVIRFRSIRASTKAGQACRITFLHNTRHLNRGTQRLLGPTPTRLTTFRHLLINEMNSHRFARITTTAHLISSEAHLHFHFTRLIED